MLVPVVECVEKENVGEICYCMQQVGGIENGGKEEPDSINVFYTATDATSF